MSQIDPQVALEIEKLRREISSTISESFSELRQYSDARSEKARNSSLAVLGFLTAILGIGGALGINYMIGENVSAAISDRVDVAVESSLADSLPGQVRDQVEDAIPDAVESVVANEEFRSLIDASLNSAVESVINDRVPQELLDYLRTQVEEAERLAERRQALEEELAAADEASGPEAGQGTQDPIAADLAAIASDAVSNSWSPQSILGQLQAQAACVALSPTSVWVTAVPRTCDNGPTCSEICSSLDERTQDGQLSGAETRSCSAALHVYPNPPAGELDRVGFKTHRYEDCAVSSCGPNYCCCTSDD